MKQTYKVSDLKRIISESSNEFKAVIGQGVEKENNSNNDKAYKEAKKRAKDFDGGLEKEMLQDKPKYEKVDGNKTTLDATPENVNDAYKKRVKAQAKGYTSELEEDNGIEKSGDFSDNEKIYNGIKDCGKKIHKAEDEFKFTKVQVRDNKPESFGKNEMYESKDGFDMRKMIDMLKENTTTTFERTNNNLKTVYFKKTEFLTEGHMLSRIPDELKKDGERFKMIDKTGNQYIVEWRNNKGNILNHINESGRDESISRMRDLFNYKSSDSNTSRAMRLDEGDSRFNETLKNARKIN